jgi:hypothetical protein
VQLLGGPAEPAVPDDRLEVSELPELHELIMTAYNYQRKTVLDL